MTDLAAGFTTSHRGRSGGGNACAALAPLTGIAFVPLTEPPADLAEPAMLTAPGITCEIVPTYAAAAAPPPREGAALRTPERADDGGRD